MNTPRLYTSALALSLAMAAGSLHAASFSCKAAATAVEQLICSNAELSALDSELAQVYQASTRSGEERQKVRQLQRQWIADVRDPCGDVACLTHAYKMRIAELSGSKAGFDCSKASTPVERLVCESRGLRFEDSQLNMTFQKTMDAGIDSQKHLAEQRQWVQFERDVCSTEPCLQTAYGARQKQLDAQYSDMMDQLKKKLGYARQDSFADVQVWPGDKNRIIALFAAQPESTDAASQGDSDFDVDIYVFDRARLKTLSHITSSASSDAIALNNIGISSKNYTSVLGVPAFAVQTHHSHIGCASYEGSDIELYAEVNHTLKSVLSPVTLSSNAGMCGSSDTNPPACGENGSMERLLEFAAAKGDKLLPTITVRETRSDENGTFNAAKNKCGPKIVKRSYTLQFDGTAYSVPKDLL